MGLQVVEAAVPIRQEPVDARLAMGQRWALRIGRVHEWPTQTSSAMDMMFIL